MGSQWRCISGHCINKTKVCDDTKDCADRSDESSETYEGCNLYPNNTEPCAISVGGERHVKCEADPAVCVPESLANTSDPSECRECGENKWQDNEGRCIDNNLDFEFDWVFITFAVILPLVACLQCVCLYICLLARLFLEASAIL